MVPYIIALLFQLNGFGAASGVAAHKDKLYFVSDDSDFLFQYSVKNASLNRIPLKENAQLQLKKKEKMDLEAITAKGNRLYLLGSGSRENRRKWIVLNTKNQQLRQFDYSGLIAEMVSMSGIPEKEINYEGLIVQGKTAYLFNRGNGKGNHNGIFEIRLKDHLPEKIVRYRKTEIPAEEGELIGFSDAVIHHGKIYFLATEERTDDTVKDGEIAGTYFGVMDPENFRILEMFQISRNQKFEGLYFRKNKDGKFTFYLCEDADNGALKSDIYEIQTLNYRKYPKFKDKDYASFY